MKPLFNFLGRFARKGLLFTLYFLSGIILALILLTTYVFINQSKLIDLLLKQFNEYELVSIYYSSIKFDTFKNFPFATFSFSDFILTLPENGNNDTLMSAQNLDLKINAARLLLGNFEINSCKAENGRLNLKTNLLKKNDINPANGQAPLLQNEFFINRFTLSSFKALIEDTLSRQKSLIGIDRLTLNIRAKNILTLNLDCQLKEINLGSKFMLNEQTQVNAIASYDGKSVFLRNVKISLSGSRLELQGLYRLENSTLGLSFKLNRTNINRLIQVTNIKRLPADITGKVAMSGKLSYNGGKKNLTGLWIDYDAQNVSIIAKGKIIEIKEINGLSYFTNNLQTHSGQVSNAVVRYENIEAAFSGRTYGTNRIIILAEGLLKLGKNEPSFTNKLTGLEGNGTFKALLELRKGNGLQSKHFGFLLHDVASEISFSLDSISAFKNLSNISGKATIRDKAIISATCYLDSSKIDFTLCQNNAIYYLNNPLNFSPSIYLNSSYLNLDSLIKSVSTVNKGGKKRVYTTVETSINTKKLIYTNYAFENVTGVMNIVGDSIYVKGLNAKGFEGKIDGDLMVVGDKYSINASMEGIDITELFRHYNSWNQKYITHNNIEGHLSGHCNFDFELDSANNIRWDRAKMNSEITINDGKLRGMNNIKKLSKWLKLDQVKSIDFTTIHNNILISNGCIYIPSMDLNSNVMGLNLSGKHFLTNDYEYHARINFSSLLAQRFLNYSADYNQPKTSSGAINLYLTLKGNSKGYEVFLDKKSSYEAIKNTINTEGQSLKEIISNEFKQTFEDSLKKQHAIQQQPTSQKFQVEWDEYDTTKTK